VSGPVCIPFGCSGMGILDGATVSLGGPALHPTLRPGFAIQLASSFAFTTSGVFAGAGFAAASIGVCRATARAGVGVGSGASVLALGGLGQRNFSYPGCARMFEGDVELPRADLPIISRSGLDSCEAVTSAGASRSRTIR